MERQTRSTVYFLLILMVALPFLQACQQALSKFEVVSLAIMPPEVTVGEEATVKAEIRNNGTIIETYDVPLMVNGVAEDRDFVSLSPGAGEIITFSLVKHEPGEYKIAIGKESSVLVVHSPPKFQLSDLTISPAEVDPGDRITVTFEVANVGGTGGKYAAQLKVNDATEDTVVVSVAAGMSQTSTSTIYMDAPGVYTVAIGTLKGQFVVREPVVIIRFGSSDNTSCPPNTRYSQQTGC